jgi:SagB-type dehydrogenase family enzyme
MPETPPGEAGPDFQCEVHLSQAVDPAHRADVERFHRRTSLVHGEAVGIECTPFLESTVYNRLAGQQVQIGARRLGSLDVPAEAGHALLRRPPSRRRFAAARNLDYPRLQRFLLEAFCAPGARAGRGAVASAGAVYPVHVILIPRLPVTSAPFTPGQVLHVAFLERALYLLAERPGMEVERACFGCPIDDAQGQFSHAAFTIAYVFDLDAGTLRYGARGYRFGLLECGAMTQQAALVANAFGLESCLFGGFADAQLAVGLGLRPQTMLVSCIQVFGEAGH